MSKPLEIKDNENALFPNLNKNLFEQFLTYLKTPDQYELKNEKEGLRMLFNISAAGKANASIINNIVSFAKEEQTKQHKQGELKQFCHNLLEQFYYFKLGYNFAYHASSPKVQCLNSSEEEIE